MRPINLPGYKGPSGTSEAALPGQGQLSSYRHRSGRLLTPHRQGRQGESVVRDGATHPHPLARLRDLSRGPKRSRRRHQGTVSNWARSRRSWRRHTNGAHSREGLHPYYLSSVKPLTSSRGWLWGHHGVVSRETSGRTTTRAGQSPPIIHVIKPGVSALNIYQLFNNVWSINRSDTKVTRMNVLSALNFTPRISKNSS